MRSVTKYAPLLGIFCAVTALAAPDGAPDAAAPPPAAAAPATNLTPAQMAAQSATIQRQLEDSSQHVAHLKDVAKKQSDVIKLNCVNDRMLEMKAQRNIADSANAQLQASLTKNSPDAAAQFAKLSGIADSVKSLSSQADGCIGETDLLKQESGVEVNHPDFPDDPGATTPGFSVGVEAPGYASPFH